MKFGKRIRSETVDEWASNYIDYKELKHLLKQLVTNGATASDEREFKKAVVAEIDKVDAFFSEHESELYQQFRALCEKVTECYLDDPAVLSKAQNAKGTSGHFNLEKLVSALEDTEAGLMIKALLQFSAKVDGMRKFVMINSLAVIKITKKHDKQPGVKDQLQSDMVSLVHRKHFYNSPKFSSLITDIQVLASQLMFNITKMRPPVEDFSCPICLGILCNPVVLSCGHRFCMKCVSAASYFCQTSCPVCRKEQILDMETIKVDTLLSHFLDRYFPERQSGVKQCKTCATRARAPDSMLGSRSRMPCEECNLQVLESLEEMQAATLSQQHKRAKERSEQQRQQQQHPRQLSLAVNDQAATNAADSADPAPMPALVMSASDELKSTSGDGSAHGRPVTEASARSTGAVAGGSGVGTEVDEEDLLAGMEVRPRLKRRSVGAGGKQALGGRPQASDADLASQAAPILLSASKLRAHFNLPLNDAAKKLGVCATAIKKVCRKMGIKQWPHRKLKAVEKRLALHVAEERYVTEPDAQERYLRQIRELEEKRDNLLQGIDCDISGVTDAVDVDEALSADRGQARGLKGEKEGKGLVEEVGNKRARSGKAPQVSQEFEDLDDDADDMFDLDGMVSPRQQNEGQTGAEQDVWAMLHRMMADDPPPQHGMQSGHGSVGVNAPSKPPSVMSASPLISACMTSSTPVDFALQPGAAGANALSMETGAGMPPQMYDGIEPMQAASGAVNALMHSHAPASSQAMMSGPLRLAQSSMLPVSHAGDGVAGSQSMVVRQSGESGATGADKESVSLQGGQVDASHVHEMRCQIETLQDEVLHLRQFSMALIRERGDLAHQMQVREMHLRELVLRNRQLEKQMMLNMGSAPGGCGGGDSSAVASWGGVEMQGDCKDLSGGLPLNTEYGALSGGEGFEAGGQVGIAEAEGQLASPAMSSYQGGSELDMASAIGSSELMSPRASTHM